jgi:hypothetical protein
MDRFCRLQNRLSNELAPVIKFSPCSAISRRTSETISRSASSKMAVPSKRGLDVLRRLLLRVSRRSLVRSPIITTDLVVRPVSTGTRDFAFTRCSPRTSTASICVSSSNIARTGVPRLCVATSCSKLRRFPKIGSTAGSPFVVRNRGLSNHAARTLRAGCCPNRPRSDGSSDLSSLATSDRGSPVIIATRDLLSRPLSLATRLAAVRTARSLAS